MEDNSACATPQSELNFKPEKEKIRFKFKTIFKYLEYKDWITFYWNRDYFKFKVNPYSYFDPRPQVASNVTSVIVLLVLFFSLVTLTVTWAHLLLIPFLFFGFGDFYLNLPFDTGKEQCEHPSYGFYVYHVDPAPGKLNMPTCVIFEWNSYNSYDFPWARTWVRTSILLKDGSWEHEVKGDRKEFYEDQWKNKQYVEEYNYRDKYDGAIIPTKIYVEEREWRQHWLKWTSLFSLVRKTIDIHFSEEVGRRKGSWKGGTIGCGYAMKKGESALDCIKRMETERDF